ncbi:MAG: GumC family protein [Crocinitomicaceae bacterium]
MKSSGTHPSVETTVTSPSDMLKKFKESIDPVELVLLVLHKWPILLITVIVASGISIFYAKSLNNVYRAGARVEVFQEDRFRERSTITEYDKIGRNSNRHIVIMSGEMFHRELLSKLSVKWSDQISKEKLRIPFQIKPLRGSRTIIDIFTDSESPEYALDYLQSILASYRSYRERELNQVNTTAISGLRSEEERIQSELVKVKNEIEQFESVNKILIAQEREQMQNDLVAELLGRLQTIQAERLILENQYKEIADADMATVRETLNMNQNSQVREFLLNQESPGENSAPGLNTSSIRSTSSANWEEREDLLASLEEKYQQDLKIYQIEHPKMAELKDQIDLLRSSLDRQLKVALDRFQARYTALQRKEAAIERAVENMQKERILPPEKENEYRRLKNHEAQLKNKFDIVYKRVLDNSDAIDSFSFITIQEPYIFRNPIGPNRGKLYVMGPIGGFALGVGFILLKWFLIPTAIPILREYKAYFKASHGMT